MLSALDARSFQWQDSSTQPDLTTGSIFGLLGCSISRLLGLRCSMSPTPVSFALLKKQAEIMFRLICCERKILFQLKKQAEKYRL